MKKLLKSRETSLLLILVIFIAFIQIRNNTFLTGSSIVSLLQNYAVIMILALGMMLVLLIGGIDISIGSTLAFSGMTGAMLIRDHQNLPIFLILLVCILVGIVVGALIGTVISKGHVPPIICTMGMMSVMRGLTYMISNNQWVSSYELPDSFKNFARVKILGINSMVWIIVLAYVIFYFMMKWTRFGRQIYAVGCNEEGARVSGIKVDKVKTLCYTILGGLVGLTSFMFVSFYTCAQNDSGVGYEMKVIAACVLGGVSLTGGRGTVIGVLLGSLLMAVIGQGLPLIGMPALWQDAIEGLIILMAIILNVIAQRNIMKKRVKEEA